MFSAELVKIVPQVEEIGRFAPLQPRVFAELLEKAPRQMLDDAEVIALINGTRSATNARILLDFAASYRRPHDRDVLLLPPLYFSSICENACRYCGFRRDGVRLTLAEFEREFSFLVDLGFRSIELVSSQDPEIYLRADDSSVEEQRYHTEALLPYVRCATSILRENGGGMLTTNIPPLDVASLRELKESGLGCFLVWQETFNPAQYRALHPVDGPKANQGFRLHSMESSITAGIQHLAGAFLKGLYDWRKEEAVLYLFDRYLKGRNGRGLSIIGSPRIKGRFAASSIVKRYAVSDEEYELNIALDRVLFDGILWLQTRERFDFNLKLMRRFGAGTILTVLCSTAPGGYATSSAARGQFPVFNQDLETSVQQLQESGFSVHLGWDAQWLEAFQRTRSRGSAGIVA